MRWRGALACAIAALVPAITIAACGSDGSSFGSPDGGTGDGALFDTMLLGFGDSSLDGTTAIRCDEGCTNGLVCVHGQCEPPQPQCFTNANCEYDSYCDPKSQTCVPYGTAPDNMTNDPSCKLTVPPGVLAPKTFCEFKAPPAGDPFPNHVDVQATPAVVSFNGKSGPPSIIVPFTQPVDMGYTEVFGIVRIIKGTDCSLEANLGGVDLDGDTTVDWVNSSSAVAVGDLDGDGVAEIVAYMGDLTTVAFTRKNGAWKPLWPKVKATLADGATIFACTIDGTEVHTPGASSYSIWSSPSIHDLDDDGFPEVIREAYVIDGRTGKVRASPPADYVSYYIGIPPVLYAMNNGVFLTNGAHVWKFDVANNAWVTDPIYDAQTSSPGWAGLADFNPFDGKKQPEIAVAVSSTLSIYDLDHTPFMGMNGLAVPGGGGGPPTIADYDGDGLPELGLAGADFYTVFDPDCQATPRMGGKCPATRTCETLVGGVVTPGPCPDYELWSRKTQDHSSNITGSSVFDFEASGIAKVVYADECFARVYDGRDGTVLFSQYHSSCTWIENPIVADVDGDFRAELVVPSNTACGPIGVGQSCGGLDANMVDAEYTGLRCLNNTDCVSGTCDNGFCRCTTGAQCCAAGSDAACLELGYSCVPPPAGTPGTGNTCRAAHPHGVQGIRVYKDANDRWVRSRTIWNQHAYAVTHVNEDGTVPKTSQWVENWSTTGLNNFRQNVPGEGDGKDIGDLTAQAGPFYTCASGEAQMNAAVCNRGTAPVGAGIPVGFYAGLTKVCTAMTPSAIDVGKCITVSCTWATPPQNQSAATDVTVKPNDGKTTEECDTDNNTGLVEKVFCMPQR
jgi:hypothetical protein